MSNPGSSRLSRGGAHTPYTGRPRCGRMTFVAKGGPDGRSFPLGPTPGRSRDGRGRERLAPDWEVSPREEGPVKGRTSPGPCPVRLGVHGGTVVYGPKGTGWSAGCPFLLAGAPVEGTHPVVGPVRPGPPTGVSEGRRDTTPTRTLSTCQDPGFDVRLFWSRKSRPQQKMV